MFIMPGFFAAVAVVANPTPQAVAVPGIDTSCSVVYHTFANDFYPSAFTDSVSIVYHLTGERVARSVTVRVAYLGRTYRYTDTIAAAAGGYETHVHVFKNLPYEATAPECAVETATFDDGSTKGTAVDAKP